MLSNKGLRIMLKKILLFSVLVTQAGCGSTPVATAMQSAVLAEPSPATTKVLNKAVSRALNGTKVLLARTVLTDTSELQIERMMQSPVAMPSLDGNLMGMPKVYRFSLKRNTSGDCFLLYPKTGNQYRLEGVKCRAL